MEIKNETKNEIQQAKNILNEAKECIVKNQEQYILAGTNLKEIKGKIKKLEQERRAMTRPLDESKKKIINLFKEPISKLEQAEKIIKQAILKYIQEQEEARKKLEEKLRKETELKEKKKKEQLLKRALKAKEKGLEDKAEELKEEAEMVQFISPTVMSQIPNQQGITTKKVWKYIIEDINIIPKIYFKLDEVKIKKTINALGAEANIPGIKIYQEAIVSATSNI